MDAIPESRLPISHKGNGNQYYYVINEWFNQNKSVLLALSIASIVLLFLLHLYLSMSKIDSDSISEKSVMLITIALVSIVAVSVIWKGIAPIALCAIGLTLIYFGTLFSLYAASMVGEVYHRASHGFATEQSILNLTHGYFFLGIGMVIFSIIIAYKPSLLYTRNRPEPMHIVWEEYPIWYDNTKVVERYNEPSVLLKSLMTDEEKYLLWRYEYILTDVHGVPYLVKPDKNVPRDSTILRHKISGTIIGKVKNFYCC